MNAAALRSAASPEWLPWLAAALLVGVVGAALIEGVVRSRFSAAGYDWRALAVTAADVLGRRAVDALGLSLAAPLLAWVHAHRVTTITLDDVGSYALLFIGVEFCYYVHHRASHRVRWFWATHCVHHSPNELTLAAALRLGWTGQLSGAALFFAPLAWLGFAPLAVLAAVALNLLYQFWLHATWIPRLGPLEWLLNTPSHHRVHHARNAAYLDCNYGGVLIVFDRLFGSFEAERADLPPRYGLTTPMHSYNPLRVELHEWAAMAREVLAARGWRERLFALLGPPGRHARPGT